MLSIHLPPNVELAVKALAFASGMAAAGVGWRASNLWLKASRIPMPPFDPPVASMDDVPELHILSTTVQLNDTTQALETSAALNARAARWTAFAAILTGAATFLAALSSLI